MQRIIDNSAIGWHLSKIYGKWTFYTIPGSANNAAQMAVASLPAELANKALLAIATRYYSKSPKDALAALRGCLKNS